MKVLYVGKFTPRHHSDIYIANAMERSGWKVARVDCCKLRGRTKSTALQMFNAVRPDILFAGKQSALDESFCNTVRARKVPIIVWYGDQRGTPAPGFAKTLARNSDWFLITNSGQLQYYKSIGARHVAFWPLATEPNIFRPMPVTAHDRSLYDTDVAFTGSNYGRKFPDSKRRTASIYNLARYMSVRTYGKKWKSRHNLIPMKPALLEKCAKVLSCARMAVGVNNYFGIRQYQSRRTWTNMSCGCCLLNHYEPGLEDIFQDHKHIVFWKTPDELVEVAKEYLKDAEKRCRIQMNARQFILENHTFDHRIALLKLFLKGKRSKIKWDQRI